MITALLIGASAPLHAAAADTALTNLIALSAERLSLAEPAAAWKWANHAEIVDRPRERMVLDAVARAAAGAGVDVETATQFFRDQIQTAQQVERALFVQWRRGPAPTGVTADLLQTTRTRLDALNLPMLTALAQVQPISRADDCPSRLAQSLGDWKNMTRFDAARDAALRQALAHVCVSGGIGATG
jgi:chorismate mutase